MNRRARERERERERERGKKKKKEKKYLMKGFVIMMSVLSQNVG